MEADVGPLAQSAMALAERQLEHGRTEGVQAALAEAAALLGFEASAPDADEVTPRELARKLRAVLGVAHPRLHPGR